MRIFKIVCMLTFHITLLAQGDPVLSRFKDWESKRKLTSSDLTKLAFIIKSSDHKYDERGLNLLNRALLDGKIELNSNTGKNILKIYSHLESNDSARLADYFEWYITKKQLFSLFGFTITNEKYFQQLSFLLKFKIGWPSKILQSEIREKETHLSSKDQAKYIENPFDDSYITLTILKILNGDNSLEKKLISRFQDTITASEKARLAKPLGLIGTTESLKALALDINWGDTSKSQAAVRSEVKKWIWFNFPTDELIREAWYDQDESEKLWEKFCHDRIGVIPKARLPKMEPQPNVIY